MGMLGEYGKASTWRRIAILLAVLVGLVVLPALIGAVHDFFTEAPIYRLAGFVDVRSKGARFRLFDRDGDRRVECVMRVPAWPWTRQSHARDGAGPGCRGRRSESMPEGMAALADEALALRTDHALSLARILDVDGDGRADCANYDGTWLYVEGARCPDTRRSDALPFTEDRRRAADRLLAIEAELLTRWLDPP
jgi:hypothetical protein